MDDLAPAGNPTVEQRDTGEPRASQRLYSLKDKDTFVVADALGDIEGVADGLFHDDTRLLSRLRLTLGGRPPTLLSAAISQDNVFFTSHGTNQDLPFPGGRVSPPGVIHLERSRFLWRERLYERASFTNYSRDEVILPVAFDFDADFHDMFEVRGSRRLRRGERLPAEVDGRSVRYSYHGLDGVTRASILSFSEPPGRLASHRAEFMIALRPEAKFDLYLEVAAEAEDTPSRERFRSAAAQARFDMRARRRHGARLHSSGRLFNQWLKKSRSDLALLTTRLDTGPYPYAGIPWFSTPFGRDAIITALQILWFNPSLARGVLAYLAATQATEVDPFRDSAPGKIQHETRKGEMTSVGDLPFGRYYGGVDTTPLFIALAGAYADRTADLAFIDRIWPNLLAAEGWMRDFGDSNGDGLLDYARGAETGLSNQGWKDSEDSVFHANGVFPQGPIALVEVQGYAFAAYQALSRLAALRGDAQRSRAWAARAEQLRELVEDRFWMEDEGFYGIAIDGHGELCRVPSSNPGHLLFFGLPSPSRAARVTKQLTSAAFDTGWGIRTLPAGHVRYNPMSYHNGSVWPHDTSICAMGLSRYGERDAVVGLVSSLFETAAHFDMRLPELFCGFPRAPGEPPVAYPVACLPQAWAAGSAFLMLQACLGVTVDGIGRALHVADPRLPIGIDRLWLQGLRIGDEKTDLLFERSGDTTAVRTIGDSPVPLIVENRS